MLNRLKRTVPRGASFFALLLALFVLLLAGQANARFVQNHTIQQAARVAAFDISITAPSNIWPDEELSAGEGNSIVFYTPGTSNSYTFTVRNNGEVTVLCTVVVEGDNPPVYTLTPNSFVLKSGEAQAVSLTLQAADDSTRETRQQLQIGFVLEQQD